MRTRSAIAAILAACGAAATVVAQDSVPVIPGGNDALSAYDSASQRVRYVVDGATVQTSWGNSLVVAPVLKASRDADPMYRTLILGSIAASPVYLPGVGFASRSYTLWTAPGGGVHPTANNGGTPVARTGFDVQLGIAASEFALNPSNVVAATIGLDLQEPTRLYVERVVAISSRPGAAMADTCTVSLGAVDAAGNVAVRADSFNTDLATSTRVLGENVLRVNAAGRTGNVNSLAAFGGMNFASDAGATAYVISNEAVPTNTPTIVGQPGSAPFVLTLDFAQRFRAGSTVASLVSVTDHLAAGVSGHRGNPVFSPFAGGPGSLGAVASLARPQVPAAKTNAVNVFDVAPGVPPTSPPTVVAASRRALGLPAPVISPAFAANADGAAESKQYLSQVSFRGGNGPMGLGRDSDGHTVVAMVITDSVTGDVLVSGTDSMPGGAWTVAAYPGQPVLNGPLGSSIGQLTAPLVISAPAVDLLGNVYFVARWEGGEPGVKTGVFKASPGGPMGHRVELLLTTGQQIAGANSGRIYTVTDLALRDGDSIASGTLHGQQIIQQQLPGRETADAASINAFGGLAVSAVLTYDNGAIDEAYDAVLLLLPGDAGPTCAADFDGNGLVQVPDIFAFLSAWFAQGPGADFDGNGQVQVPDIFAFLSAWFAGC